MMRSLRTLVTLAAAAALLAGCAVKRASSPVSTGSEAVSVQADSLFDEEAARDPVVTYRLRLATQPDNPALHNNLGNLLVLRNWMDEAVEEYRKALKLNADSHIAWNNLGTALMKMGRRGAAMDAFREAVDKNPRYALGWYNIGVVLDENENYDGAIEMYLKAAALQPEMLEPEVNPQVVNNRHLMAIRLRRYLEEEGNLALPLEAMPE
jgi:tetratricopeptide (TPR) repeat protein